MQPPQVELRSAHTASAQGTCRTLAIDILMPSAKCVVSVVTENKSAHSASRARVEKVTKQERVIRPERATALGDSASEPRTRR